MYISNEKRENLDRSVKLSQVIPLSLVGPDQVQRVSAVDWRSSTDSQGISSKPFIGADPGIVKSTNRNSTENVFSVPKYMSYAPILHTRTISCCTVFAADAAQAGQGAAKQAAMVCWRCNTLHRVATCVLSYAALHLWGCTGWAQHTDGASWPRRGKAGGERRGTAPYNNLLLWGSPR